MATNFRFSEPNYIQNVDKSLVDYLNQLVRELRSFDEAIFSQTTGTLFETSRKRPFIQVSAAYSAGQFDSVILADSSGGSFAITLPTALDWSGTYIDVKKIDTNAATVVSVEGSGGDMPVILNGNDRPSVTLFSDGNDIWII